MRRAVLIVFLSVAASTTAEGTLQLLYPPYLAGYGYTLSSGVIVAGVATFVLPWAFTFSAYAALFFVAGLARGILRVTSAAMAAELRGEGHDVGLASGV